jgi:hypothetical protein
MRPASSGQTSGFSGQWRATTLPIAPTLGGPNGSKRNWISAPTRATYSFTKVPSRHPRHILRRARQAGNVFAFPGIFSDQRAPDQIGRCDDLVTLAVLAIPTRPKKAARRRPWQDPRGRRLMLRQTRRSCGSDKMQRTRGRRSRPASSPRLRLPGRPSRPPRLSRLDR